MKDEERDLLAVPPGNLPEGRERGVVMTQLLLVCVVWSQSQTPKTAHRSGIGSAASWASAVTRASMLYLRPKLLGCQGQATCQLT